MQKPTFKKPVMTRPTIKKKPLPSMAPAPDPFKKLKDTGEVETDAKAELTALQAAFRERAKNEASRFEDATDTGYYTCLVMENRDQLDAIIAHFRDLGANIDEDMFLDGREIARVLGVELPKQGVGGGKLGRIDKAFAKMVRRS